MLIPRKVKHRKQRRIASGGTSVTFGDYGIQALEHAYITNRQIESARIAINRHIKRGGKVWINIFPDRPLTKKPAETRMGSGKGSPEWWVANVKPGRELFELRFQMATGQLSNNRRLRTVRHQIARIYTVLHERELGLASGPEGEGS